MGAIVDIAILSLILLVAVFFAYFIADILVLFLYAMIRYGSMRHFRENWPHAIKSSVISAFFNNLTIALVSLIVLNRIFTSGAFQTDNFGAGPFSRYAGAIGLGIYSFGRVILYSIISFFAWLLISIGILAFFLRKNKPIKENTPVKKYLRIRKKLLK